MRLLSFMVVVMLAALLFQSGSAWPSDPGAATAALSKGAGPAGNTLAATPVSGATFVAGSPPVVSGFSPTSGPRAGGTAVVIQGSNFTGATAVTFGSSPASSFTVNSNTQITAVSPSFSVASTVPITVTTAVSTSVVNPNAVFTFNNAYGAADGAYDFGGLNDFYDSAGVGYARLGDKFKVGNFVFKRWKSCNTGPLTALFMNSSTSAATAIIKAEGGAVCKTFTFKDLGISASAAGQSFQSLDIVLKDVNGATINVLSLGGSTAFSTDSVTSISALYGQGPWSIDGVAEIDIIFVLKNGMPAYNLSLENITLANVTGASVPLPVVSGISPSSGSTFGGTSVTITGSNFTGFTAVKFGLTDAVGSYAESDTRITAISPPGAAGLIADITVVSLGGTSVISPAGQFTYTQDQAMNFTTGNTYATLAGALSAAQPGAEIDVLDTQLDGAVNLDKAITLSGGWDSAFMSQSGTPTTLNGDLTIQSGGSTVGTVDVKGKLVVQSGSLRANGVTVMQ